MIILYQSIKSILRILLRSKRFSLNKHKKRREHNVLKILGNGNSLNDSDYLEADADYMVVNRHVIADNYSLIKPAFYTIADPHFFSHPEGLSILEKISNSTTWNMTLFVPYTQESYAALSNCVHNDKIELCFYNSQEFQGYKFLAYLMYDWQLSMPRVQNVLVAGIMLGILMKYKRIELYGVEHSWTKYLFVGNDNLVYLENPHFYDKEKVTPKPFKELQHVDDFPMWFALECFMYMFKSYSIIADYIKVKKIDVKVVNKTPDSFIDAFDRS